MDKKIHKMKLANEIPHTIKSMIKPKTFSKLKLAKKLIVVNCVLLNDCLSLR